MATTRATTRSTEPGLDPEIGTGEAVAAESGKTPAKKSSLKKSAKADTTAAAKKATPAQKPAAKMASTAKKATTKNPSKKPAAKKSTTTKMETDKKDAAGETTDLLRARKPKGALVVVESHAKAKTIKKYLGSGYTVKASVGHVKDLPKSKLGVDPEKDFEPEYVVIDGKVKALNELKKAARASETVYLATDPDREGEAIAWHIAEELEHPNAHRVMFNEITKSAVQEAIANPLELDRAKYDSQQTRRILDRIVGYQISPLLWKKIRRGLSAGRVQSVAVRLIVEREQEIQKFVPVEYWSLDAKLEGPQPPPFMARLARIDGEKAEVHNGEQAHALAEEARAATFVVSKVDRRERKRNAPAPFITSKLQQEASNRLHFSPKKTMTLAQRLYEGVALGDEGQVALITYMRTDSTRLSDQAVADVRTFISSTYGPDSIPAEPNVFRGKKNAQDAHEAIRPTSLEYPPERVRHHFLQMGEEDMFRLYELIWRRFVACQMKPAVYDQTR